MKRVFITCNKRSCKYIHNIKKILEFMGYEVILPNFSDEFTFEEKIRSHKLEDAFEVNELSLESQEKLKNSDALLVLNYEEEKEGSIYKNYIEQTVF